MAHIESIDKHDTELLRRIENLIKSFQGLVKDAVGSDKEESLVYGLRAIVTLANMVLRGDDIFGIEPWHVLADDVPLSQPGEMLLRLKDYKGKHMPPYPAIMAFYESGYTAEIDGILFLAALGQFIRSEEKQVSINISARSLRDPDFVRCTLDRLETLECAEDEKIIIEIHESTPNLTMSRHVLALYKKFGVAFALDDVGLNMNDIMRLAEFDQLASFIKIDRHAVCAVDGASNSLQEVVNFVHKFMPEVVMVAEGVQDAEHALAIKDRFPEIHYVQGLYLPENRKKFQMEMHNASVRLQTEGDEGIVNVGGLNRP